MCGTWYCTSVIPASCKGGRKIPGAQDLQTSSIATLCLSQKAFYRTLLRSFGTKLCCVFLMDHDFKL